jgi:hypothetical protein
MTSLDQYRRSVDLATPEDEVLQSVALALTLAGWVWTHHRRSDRALVQGDVGLPDIIAAHPQTGALVAIECKAERGVVSEGQARWIHALGVAGVAVSIARPSTLADICAALIARQAPGSTP